MKTLFTLVEQIVDRVEVMFPSLHAKLEGVRYYNRNRQQLLQSIDDDQAKAKHWRTAAFTGQSLS